MCVESTKLLVGLLNREWAGEFRDYVVYNLEPSPGLRKCRITQRTKRGVGREGKKGCVGQLQRVWGQLLDLTMSDWFIKPTDNR